MSEIEGHSTFAAFQTPTITKTGCASFSSSRRPVPIQNKGDPNNMATTIKINGVDRSVDVDDDTPLLWVLRDVLEMSGTKFGCGQALCGACTVHVDGVATRSCVTTIDSLGSSEVTTIEAIGQTPAGAKIQKAWLDLEVVQCGYCQSGQIMSASALIAENPNPTDQDIDDAMSGNICRCGTYIRIREAIKLAARSLNQGG
jgi:isoquinoline 1-oxidoreductase alpha subunit